MKKHSPPVNLGADKRMNYGFCPVTLEAGEQFTSYLWNTGETGSSIEVNTAGTYSVTVTDIFGFVSSDEVEVKFPAMGLNVSDTTLCEGASLWLEFSSAFTNDVSLLWSTGETTPGISVSEAGTYGLLLSDTLGCSINLSATVTMDYFASTANLGPARPFCMGDTLWLQSQWLPNEITYLWNDGSSLPYLVVQEPGDYSLTATNPNGCVANTSTSLSLQGYAPVVSFSAAPVCFGLPTAFSDASTVAQSTLISHTWHFADPGDMQASATGTQASHTYTQAGLFPVRLEVESAAGCSKSLTQMVQVYHLPLPAFGPPNTCAHVLTSFNDQSTDLEGGIASWQWKALDTDGSPLQSSGIQHPQFSFPTPGTASLQLITTSLVGCIDSLSRPINVRHSPQVDFIFTTACLGENVSFTNLSVAPPWAQIQSSSWDFGDGNTTTQDNPSHLFQSAGLFPVTLTARAINGCEVSTTKQIVVNHPPQVSFSTPVLCASTPHQFEDLSSVSLSTIASWKWNFSGLGSSTQQNPTFSFELPGQYNISLSATSAAGCSDSITQPIDVMLRPTAAFSYSPNFGVAPLTVNFQNLSQGASTYLWDFGDGAPSSNAPNPSHTYTQNGIYQASLISTSTMGCLDTTLQEIRVTFSSLDIALSKIHHRIENGYLIVGATLLNLGTRTIENLHITAIPHNLSPIMESWQGKLPSGDLLYFEFSARFPIAASMPQYLCMEVEIPGISSDDHPENNRLCLALENTFNVLPPFPNPATSSIQLSFILPEEDNISILLFDANGNLIDKVLEAPAPQGINSLNLNASALRPGIYAFRITYRDQILIRRVVKL